MQRCFRWKSSEMCPNLIDRLAVEVSDEGPPAGKPWANGRTQPYEVPQAAPEDSLGTRASANTERTSLIQVSTYS